MAVDAGDVKIHRVLIKGVRWYRQSKRKSLQPSMTVKGTKDVNAKRVDAWKDIVTALWMGWYVVNIVAVKIAQTLKTVGRRRKKRKGCKKIEWKEWE